MRFNDENQMTVGDYYPDPPRRGRDPDEDRDAFFEGQLTSWRESSVRTCPKCLRVARLFDGEHADCPVKKEVKSVTKYAIISGVK